MGEYQSVEQMGFRTKPIVRVEDVHKLVTIMADDPVVCMNKERLGSAMCIAGGTIQAIRQRMIINETGPEGFLKEIIQIWIATRGNFATFAELDRILRQEGFKMVADKLETTF